MFNCAVFLWSIMRSLNLSIVNRFSLRMLLGYSWPLYPVAFVSLLDNWFDRALLLGYSLSELGVYNVAFKAFGYLYAIPIAISDAFFPHFSELKSREGIDKLSSTFTSTSRYLAMFATPLALGLAAVAEPVISLFAGRGYASAGQPLTVLCVAAAVSVFGLMLGKILLVLDETRIYSLIVLGTVVAGLALGKLLVPMLGPVGASAARATSMLLALVFLLVATSRKIRIMMDKEALWKSLGAGIIMSARLRGGWRVGVPADAQSDSHGRGERPGIPEKVLRSQSRHTGLKPLESSINTIDATSFTSHTEILRVISRC